MHNLICVFMQHQAPLEFDVVHVDLSNKPRWYRQVNPAGLVPAVTQGNATLLESMDICRCICYTNCASG